MGSVTHKLNWPVLWMNKNSDCQIVAVPCLETWFLPSSRLLSLAALLLWSVSSWCFILFWISCVGTWWIINPPPPSMEEDRRLAALTWRKERWEIMVVNRSFVSELSQLEPRSQAGPLKRGRTRCREDRRVTRIRNTWRSGLTRCDPRVPLTYLYRQINMQGGGCSSAADGCKSPMMTKGWLKTWNIFAFTPGVAQISHRLSSHTPVHSSLHQPGWEENQSAPAPRTFLLISLVTKPVACSLWVITDNTSTRKCYITFFSTFLPDDKKMQLNTKWSTEECSIMDKTERRKRLS